MEQCKIVNMYDLNETIAKDYMETAEYPWELLDGLSDYIKNWELLWIRRNMRNAARMYGLQKCKSSTDRISRKPSDH